MEQATSSVTITAFGQGRFAVPLVQGNATLAELLRLHRVESASRRVAVNGHPAGPGSTVLEGDEVTVVPRVRAG